MKKKNQFFLIFATPSLVILQFPPTHQLPSKHTKSANCIFPNCCSRFITDQHDTPRKAFSALCLGRDLTAVAMIDRRERKYLHPSYSDNTVDFASQTLSMDDYGVVWISVGWRLLKLAQLSAVDSCI